MKRSAHFHNSDDKELVEIAAANLTPLMIDWLVGIFDGVCVGFDGDSIRVEGEPYEFTGIYSPSTDPSIGHPLLEREKIQARYIDEPGHPKHGSWLAQDCRFRSSSMSVEWRQYGHSYPELALGYMSGPTMLIASMRFIIAKHYVGKSKTPMVRVPKQLIKRTRKPRKESTNA
ncbi:hypothetical protein ACI77O_12385 [Pseudomonas tritici]|uniref:hypothetical protein n=1 Tax=Pseudomonas tritici TaxID=2745518 RepID=UPI00387AD86B